nr:CRTAC1 family protein [Sulfitobacter aestuariivivens]
MCLLVGSANAQPLFEDLSERLPPHTYTGGWEHFVGGGVALLDCDGDALPDIFAAGGSKPAILIRNKGAFKFVQSPVLKIEGTTGAYPIDLDSDGHTDLFVLRVGANRFLKGGPDCTFTDATDAIGLPQLDQWSTAFTAWWDTDADRPNLAVGNYVDRKDPDGPFEACDDNVLLRADQGSYVPQTLSPGYCALSILTARDARGRATLRLSNDRHYYVSGGFEQMWDIEDERFLGPEDGWPTVSLWGMGIASRDLTGDGRDEVMLTSMGDQLLQIAQDDGTYKNAPYSIGTYAQRPYTGGDGRPSTGWHAEFADVDNDGRVDLFIAKGNVDQMPGMATKDPNNLLMQQADGTFEEAGETAGIASIKRSRGAGLADFDGDGRLDLVVMNRRSKMGLYRNVTPLVGAWIGLRLSQSGSNSRAVGAVVTVNTVAETQTAQVLIGGGHAGGQALPLHFGLGKSDTADVHVSWPDGTKTRHEVRAGKTHVLHKPD